MIGNITTFAILKFVPIYTKKKKKLSIKNKDYCLLRYLSNKIIIVHKVSPIIHDLNFVIK